MPHSLGRESFRFLVALALCLDCARVTTARGTPDRDPRSQQTAQTESSQTIRSEVEVQTVAVQVKDKKGNDVKGLAATDFAVREDGSPQKIAFFDAGNGPVDVVVLVDSSGSMVSKWHLGAAQEIASRFMRIARPGDRVWAMDFTEWLGPFKEITADQLSSGGPVSVPLAGGSGSSIYDAIASAVCHLRDSRNERQAIIVITDGADQHSRISLDRLIGLSRSQRAQLFLIGLPSRPWFDFKKKAGPKVMLVSGHDIDSPSVVFDRLAKESGAQTYTPDSEQGIQEALKAVSDLLELEYTLAFYPPANSRKLRKIEVKVDRPGVRVLATRYAVANRDSEDVVHFLEGTCTVSPVSHPYPYESHVTNGSAGMIYGDDFSDSNSGWPQHPNSGYVSGGYELSTFVPPGADDASPQMSGARDISTARLTANRPTTYRDNVVAAYGPSWNDFRMSATMKPLLASDMPGVQQKFTHPVRAAAGLVFRMNQTGYYAVLIGGPPEDKKLSFELVARRFEGDSFAETIIVPWSPVEVASVSEVRLAVEVIADQITVFLDGQQIISVRDGTYSNGYAGFAVSAPASATFENLVVEQK